MVKLKAPFPYAGGKSTVAHIVWQALGQPKHYIEPFFGSGAVLLNRPQWLANMVETVNDKDAHLANVWRSLQFNPDEVARWCDWPVNHVDLSARKSHMIKEEGYLKEGLLSEPEWYDAKLAGYWIWAASCWIGTGLTTPSLRCGIGQIPHLGHGGKGVHAIGKIPHLGHGGMGVHAIGKIPHLSNGGMGVHAIASGIHEWFAQLSARLRRVRVVCGDWQRVCGGDWQDKIGDVGIFFDPPYGVEDRDTRIYHHDSTAIAPAVMEWCKERGERKRYRIVLAGYEEYQELVDNNGWTKYCWKTSGGYANTSRNKTQGDINKHREILYFSPHCLNTGRQGKLL